MCGNSDRYKRKDYIPKVRFRPLIVCWLGGRKMEGPRDGSVPPRVPRLALLLTPMGNVLDEGRLIVVVGSGKVPAVRCLSFQFSSLHRDGGTTLLVACI